MCVCDRLPLPAVVQCAAAAGVAGATAALTLNDVRRVQTREVHDTAAAIATGETLPP